MSLSIADCTSCKMILNEATKAEDEKPKTDEQDQILQVLGNIGTWQWKNILITAVFCVPCCWHILCMTFMNASVSVL